MPRMKKTAKMTLKFKNNNEKYERNLIAQSLKIFNSILNEIKMLKSKKFSNKILKIWLIKQD